MDDRGAAGDVSGGDVRHSAGIGATESDRGMGMVFFVTI